jgi:hypothetical protein
MCSSSCKSLYLALFVVQNFVLGPSNFDFVSFGHPTLASFNLILKSSFVVLDPFHSL